jgi:acyl-CoA thioesterase-2
MPTSGEIVGLLAVEALDRDSFLGAQPETWSLDKVYGGQLFGQGLAAAQRTVDPQRPAHAVQASFLTAGDHDSPVRYDVERVRDGRSFSSRAVVATQAGRPVMRLMASFHSPEPGLAHAAPMPSIPAPDGLPTIQDVIRDVSDLPDEPWRREWAGLDIRYGTTPDTGRRTGLPGRQQIWIRVKDALPDEPALHRLVLAYLSDIALLNAALVPHGLVMGARELPRATLNHSVWLHAAGRGDEWLLVDQRSPWAGSARGLSLAEVFTGDGRHIASYAQEGVIRPHGQLRQELELDS